MSQHKTEIQELRRVNLLPPQLLSGLTAAEHRAIRNRLKALRKRLR